MTIDRSLDLVILAMLTIRLAIDVRGWLRARV